MRLSIDGTTNPEQLAKLVVDFGGEGAANKLREGALLRSTVHLAVRRWAADVVDAACPFVGVFGKIVGPDERVTTAANGVVSEACAPAVDEFLAHLRRHTTVEVEWVNRWRQGRRQHGFVVVHPAVEAGLRLGVSPRTEITLAVDPDLFPY